MAEGLSATQATGAGVFRPFFLSLLAQAHAAYGQALEGVRVLDEASTLVDAQGERFWEAEIYRLKGELTATCDAQKGTGGVEECLQQALALARRQQAKSLELRTATNLARLWKSQGKRQAAYDLLVPVYGWFTEGFDMADLKEAKVLLDSLRE
jgi:predicted ATPase